MSKLMEAATRILAHGIILGAMVYVIALGAAFILFLHLFFRA